MRVKGKASSSQPTKKAKAHKREEESKDATVTREETHTPHGKDLQAQHGRDGAAPRDGAVPGHPQRHGGSKDDDLEGY